LDYREIQPRLQLVRGPYTIAAGVAAYEQHSRPHQQLRAAFRQAVDQALASALAGQERNTSAHDRFAG